MIEEQKVVNIEIGELLNKVSELKQAGYRLAQIGCAIINGVEINYSFDKDYVFINLRLNLTSSDTEIPSISRIYGNAFLYENEMRDLFGIKVKDIVVDYQGNFYRTAVKWPFRPKESA